MNTSLRYGSYVSRGTLAKGWAMGARHYIATNEGLRRVANKVIMEDQGALPQFAGTRQKVVYVHTVQREGKLLFRAMGQYAEFDQDGRFYLSLATLLRVDRQVEAYVAIEKERLENGIVRDISLRQKFRKLKDSAAWEISAEEQEAIVMDLLGPDRPKGTKAIPLLKVKYP
jgi:hypothetical protein